MSRVIRFRTKPVEIDAIRFTFESGDEIKEWTTDPVDETCAFNWGYEDDREGGNDLWGQVFDVLHDTWINVFPGQWIVRGAKGEFYPCDNETFHWKYEVANESNNN